VGDPPIAELALNDLANDNQLPGAQTNEDRKLVALDIRVVSCEELDDAVRMPRRSVKSDEGILFGPEVAESEDAALFKNDIKSIRVDALG
jgi:hypothetical protein